MSKMKSHKGARKRFRKTRTGKILRNQAGDSHLKEVKTAARRRRLQRRSSVSAPDRPRVKRMLGG